MPPEKKPRRRSRLVPVKGDRPERRPDAVPVAKQVLERAHRKIGPDGIADVESRLAAAKEIEDEVERGGASHRRGVHEQFPVRLCSTDCSFRVGGGPGCTVYQRFLAEQGYDLDGEQCERDILVLQETTDIFKEGKEDKVRELAGRFTGAMVLQLQNLLQKIIAEGATREIPIFDAKGAAVYNEELMLDSDGEVVYGKPNAKNVREPKVIRTLITKPIEHPAFPRLTMLLKEMRLIDFAQYELTPKSSQVPAQTDGMILAGDDEPQTIDAIKGALAEEMKKFDKVLIVAAERTAEDPTYQRMKDKFKDVNASAGTKVDP